MQSGQKSTVSKIEVGIERMKKRILNCETFGGCLIPNCANKGGKMRIVLFQGAWEIINWGHVKAFERAKKLGDILILALNTNRLLKKYKKRDAVLPWYQKKKILESIRWVDKVIPAHNASPLSLLKKYNADVFVLTKEWEHAHADSIAYMKAKGGKVVFSTYYKKVVSTSEIKRRLLAEAKDGV